MKGIKMLQGNQKHTIYTKEYISEKEFNEIRQLEGICRSTDRTNLKLELDYKLYISNTAKANSERMNKQANQDNEEKVGKQFDSHGITFPEWKRKMVFLINT
jgi:hypothetical protein